MSRKNDVPNGRDKAEILELKILDAKKEIKMRKKASGDKEKLEKLREKVPHYWKKRDIHYRRELKKGTFLDLKPFKDQYLSRYLEVLEKELEATKNIEEKKEENDEENENNNEKNEDDDDEQENNEEENNEEEKDYTIVDPRINPQGFVKYNKKHMNCVDPTVNPGGFIKSQSPLTEEEKHLILVGKPAKKSGSSIRSQTLVKINEKKILKKNEIDELKKPKLRRMLRYKSPDDEVVNI